MRTGPHVPLCPYGKPLRADGGPWPSCGCSAFARYMAKHGDDCTCGEGDSPFVTHAPMCPRARHDVRPL